MSLPASVVAPLGRRKIMTGDESAGSGFILIVNEFSAYGTENEKRFELPLADMLGSRSYGSDSNS